MSLSEGAVLDVLDESCQNADSWPVFSVRHPDRAYHALRLTAFRQRDGDGWLVVFECLEGSSEDTLRVRRYVQAPHAIALTRLAGCPSLFVDGQWNSAAENVVVGPHGSLVLTREALCLLAPERATASDAIDMHFTLLVRAYLKEYSQAFWLDEGGVRAVLAREGIDLTQFELLLESEAFEHVVGHVSDDFDPDGIDERWRRLPSESPTYQSLARAIGSRDASLFRPGTSNLDWRLHLDAPRASRRF